MKQRAYAKINLALNLINRREDGYHNLDTIMVPIDFYDVVDIEISDHDELISNEEYLKNNPLSQKEKTEALQRGKNLLNAIDIMDEAGIIASRMNTKEVRKSDVLKVVLEMNGLINQQFKNLNYPILIPYYQNYLNAMMRNTLVNINASCEHLPFLYDDFSKIFNVTDEAILEINLEEYNAPHMNSMLIGSPPGYVGYENGGILTEHILKYPIAIVALKNYDLASPVIQSQIKSFVEEGKVIDAKGRKIYFANTIFIFISKTNVKNVGFIAQKKQEETFFDITIDQDVNYYCKLQTLFKHYAIHNYFFRINLKKITYKQFTLIRNYILKTSNFKKHQRYLITLNDEKIAIEKT